jgi:hypothetical protein
VADLLVVEVRVPGERLAGQRRQEQDQEAMDTSPGVRSPKTG